MTDQKEQQHYVTEIGSEPSTAWMLTFADLLSLLLAFFILLYSMSVVTTSSWEDVTKSLNNKLNPQFFEDETEFSTDLGVQRSIQMQAMDLGYLYTILQEKLQHDNFVNEHVTLTQLDGRLRIRIASDSLFTADSSSLTQDAQLILFGVGDVLQQVNNSIEVYAAVTDRALQKSEYPSQWELALARAIIVAEELRKFGYNDKINAFGQVIPTYGQRAESNASSDGTDQLKGGVVDIVVGKSAAIPLK